MDVATGLFGRLDFVSSGLISCTESGEFRRLARATVDRAISNQKSHRPGRHQERNSIELSTPQSVMFFQALDPPSSSFMENAVAEAMPETDISSVSGIEVGPGSENQVMDGVNTHLAINSQATISVGQGGDWNMLTGFEWANMDEWPDPGPDYVQASPFVLKSR